MTSTVASTASSAGKVALIEEENPMKFRLRRNLPAGLPDPGADPNDHTPDQADDLFAPEFAVLGHGFVRWDVVRQTGPNSHLKAKADSLPNFERLGLVVHVRDVDNYSVLSNCQGVWITAPYATAHGQGADDAPLFLDWITPGNITTTELADPLLGWIKSIGSVIDADNLWIEFKQARQP